MRRDVIEESRGSLNHKPLCKETLNHRELMMLASGIDPLIDTKGSYLKSYEALGIDFVNRVPIERCRPPLDKGQSEWVDKYYSRSSLGVYDTWYRHTYPYPSVDEFMARDEVEELDYHELRTPVPHPLESSDISRRETILGEIGTYYCQLYTTLFMWGIEYLGWEVFMLSIAMDSERLDKHFLTPAFEQTCKLTDVLLECDSPYLFFHDDIATGESLACSREWMKRYLFERYTMLFERVHDRGKKVVFVCDGNCTEILEDLRSCGVDAVMLESPATRIETIAEVFEGRLIIGGIDTKLLTHGTPDQISSHVHTLASLMKDQHFAISSCGGLHDGIPIENLEAYFDTRSEYGFNTPDWRN